MVSGAFYISSDYEVGCVFHSDCFSCPYPACRKYEYSKCLKLEARNGTPATVISQRYEIPMRKARSLVKQACVK